MRETIRLSLTSKQKENIMDTNIVDTLTPEQLAIAAVRARQLHPDMVKSLSKEARKASAKAKLEAERAERCDPTNPKYDAAYAARVASRAHTKDSGAKSSKATDTAKKEALMAILTKSGTVLTLEQVKKASVIPLHNDDTTIRGFRAVVKIKKGGDDEQVSRKQFLLAEHAEKTTDDLKAMAEAYLVSKLAEFKAA